ncbi:MAG: prepilin-type N-terminal cleavage/methylation domain-containing protein [candidate division Zixibacteria bacterium]|nr:prepilin-type N-terminal cleavage/methylation domain-containing protein [candidate division Zixibacteria bacterium]
MNRSNISRSLRQNQRMLGFTLTELLVAMGVIAVLSVLVVMSMSAISKDARLASGVNTVKAALENARAMAMKKNQIVMVVFRPRLEGVNKRKQVVEVITAKWTGESAFINNQVTDRFVVMPEVAIRTIPSGIKIAGPGYGTDDDLFWITQAHLPAIDQVTGAGEAYGNMLAVMYGPDGTTISRNSQSDSNSMFVDFNNNGGLPDADPSYPYNQWLETDEPYVVIAPFLAIFDDDEAREVSDTTLWDDDVTRTADITYYINVLGRRSKRIHFNRYTGVMMK